MLIFERYFTKLEFTMDEEKNKLASSYIKYSSIAFQMLATIGIMTFIGYKMDSYRESNQPIFTALFGLLGVVISLVQIIRSLKKDK